MDYFLIQALQSETQWVRIFILILVLVLAWVILRYVFRLATRVFAGGCLVLMILVAVIIFIRYFN